MTKTETLLKMFRLAKQTFKKSKNVIGAKFLECDGKLLTCDPDVLSQWQSYLKLSNGTFPFERKLYPPVAGPLEEFTIQEMAFALRKMKTKKNPGPTANFGHDKICQGLSTCWNLEILQQVWDSGLIPFDGSESERCFYKVKGDPLECGSLRGTHLKFSKSTRERLRHL